MISSEILKRKTNVTDICWFFSPIWIPHGRLAPGKTQNKVKLPKYFRKKSDKIFKSNMLITELDLRTIRDGVILSVLKVLRIQKPQTYLVKYRFYANTLWSLISKENASFPNISPSKSNARGKKDQGYVSQSQIYLNQEN